MIPISPRDSVVPLALVVVFFYTTFTMGAATGASAVLNESQSVETAETEFVDSKPAVKANVSANLTGAGQLFEPMLMSLVDGAYTTTRWGIGVGAASPTFARVNAEAAPFVMLGGIGFALYRRLQVIRGETA
jgi:hypothetical protein